MLGAEADETAQVHRPKHLEGHATMRIARAGSKDSVRVDPRWVDIVTAFITMKDVRIGTSYDGPDAVHEGPFSLKR